MNTHGRLGEFKDIFLEPLSISSAAGTTSLVYDVSDATQFTVIVGGGTALAGTTANNPAITVRQSGDSAGATSTTITGATGSLGISTALQVPNAKTALITMTTAATLTNSLVINGVTLTYSTAPQSTAASSYTFGSSLGATAEGGLEGTMASLATVINASTALGEKLIASTVTTAACQIMVRSSNKSTDVNVAATGVQFTPTIIRQQSIIEVPVDRLNSTSQYVFFTVSSASTAIALGGSLIKSGIRYKPPHQVGQYVKTPTT